MVSAKEEPDSSMPPAMDGLLRVHKRIIDVDGDSAQELSRAGGMVTTRLLAAAQQAGSLIGKQGATIKSIQDASGCNIRVLGGENLPHFALPDDSVVEIQGEPGSVHKAVELIATHLRRFLADRSVVQLFEMQMQNPKPLENQNMAPPPQHEQPWGPPPQGFPMNTGAGLGFGPPPSNQQYMQQPPPRQLDNYYPPGDMPSMDRQPPRQGPPMYGRDAPMGGHSIAQPQQHQHQYQPPHQHQPPPYQQQHQQQEQYQQPQPQQHQQQQQQASLVTKVTQNMQIPLSYADAVIGTSGANISYIRRASGATIAIQETRGVPGEMTVEINGSASQIQAAQQLIQNFIAEAASSAQNAAGMGGVVNQGYNTYPAQPPPAHSQAPVYQSPPSNPTGHPPVADYGPVYGANYGY